MKTDINGCSSCPAGEERYESFFHGRNDKEYVQYDYRTPEGKLFSCIKPTLAACRAARDAELNRSA